MSRKKRSPFDIRGRVLDMFRELVNLRAPAREIALGMAVGVFIGWLPIVGIQMITVVVLCFPFKRVNKPAAVAGVWFSNPVTVIPIYVFIYWVGKFFYPGENMLAMDTVREKLRWIMSIDGPFEQFMAYIGLGADVFIPMFIGGGIVGALSIPPVYILTRRLVIAYRWKRRPVKSNKI